MAISGISQSLAAVGAFDSQAQSSDANNNPLTTFVTRQAAAQTQLSGFGRVKSSLADLQAKAQALKNFSKPPTFEDLKGVVQGFVQSFNALNKTVNEVSSQSQNSLNGDARPGQALSDVRKAAGGINDGSAGALQKLGIDSLKDGTLSISQGALLKSFQSDRAGTLTTLSNVADRVGKAIDKQLSSSGFIGQKTQDLSARANEPASNRNPIQDRLDIQKSYQQRLAAQLANAGGYVARNAVATYFSVASL